MICAAMLLIVVAMYGHVHPGGFAKKRRRAADLADMDIAGNHHLDDPCAATQVHRGNFQAVFLEQICFSRCNQSPFRGADRGVTGHDFFGGAQIAGEHLRENSESDQECLHRRLQGPAVRILVCYYQRPRGAVNPEVVQD
jgi:hypothetical protein